MITLTLHRADLVAARACEDGLTLYDAIAAACPPVRVRLRSGRVVERRDRIRVQWTPLAQLWLAREYPSWSAWLYETGLAPRVSLGGANLGGAYLGGADLGGAYLARAYLVGANLGGAYLGGANLGGAYLARAYLVGAYLGGANLGGANLGGAWRDPDDPSIDGWRVVTGQMVRS